MDFGEFKEGVEYRKLELVNVPFASLLAGLHEYGLLNQGLMYFVAREAGRKPAGFARIKGMLGSQTDVEPIEKVSNIVEKLNEVLKIGNVDEAAFLH